MDLTHPQYFEKSRPYTKELVNVFKYATSQVLPGNDDVAQVATDIVMKNYVQDTGMSPLTIKYKHINMNMDINPLLDEILIAQVYASFAFFGKNIYRFDPDIIEEFKHTEINEVPVASLKFPFPTFYMSFGLQNDLQFFKGKSVLTGAYITHDKDAGNLQIVITLSNINEGCWVESLERHYNLTIDVSDPDQTIINEVDKEIQSVISGLNSDIEDINKEFIQSQKDVKGGHAIGGVFKGIAEVYKNDSEIFKKSLNLIINGLCFITAYQDDIEEGWSDNAPSELVLRYYNPRSPKEFQKAKSQLSQSGFVKLNFCGRKLAKSINSVHEHDGGKKKRAHWRRGHWRNQAHGIKHTLRKLVWIRPMPVGLEIDENVIGHIYEVTV